MVIYKNPSWNFQAKTVQLWPDIPIMDGGIAGYFCRI